MSYAIIITCVKSYPVPPTPNSALSSTIAKKPVPYALHLKNWATHSRQHQCPLTTTQQAALPLTLLSNKNAFLSKQSTGVYIGSLITSAKANFFWSKGGMTNRAGYFPKHHPTSHHASASHSIHIATCVCLLPTNPLPELLRLSI